MSPKSELPFFKRVRRIEVVAAKLVDEFLAGNYRSIFRGQGIEFDEVRDYVSGDDIRSIDWNVTSRLGAPYTKVFREERETTLFLIVDVSASLKVGSGEVKKDEFAALVFANLALSAVKNNDRVGAAFFSDQIERWVPPAKGRKHILRLIHDLLTLEADGNGSDLQRTLKGVHMHSKRRGICFIISDFKTDGYWETLSLLSRKHDCVAVKIFDPVDLRFPNTGMIELQDPETGELVVAEGASSRFRQGYRQFWSQRHRRWLEHCRQRGVDTLTLSTSDDPGQELIRFFRRRRKRVH